MQQEEAWEHNMPIEMPGLDVWPATTDDLPLLESLLRFYIYDFSEFEDAGSDRLSLNHAGQFRISIQLAPYLDARDRWAYVIWFKGHPAGFAFINTQSHVGEPIDLNMGEFFIARKYRRCGLATAALHEILARHPGRWEVAVIEPNVGAQKFWPQAIRSAPNVTGLRRVPHDGSAWNGPVWSFVSSLV
jgi:predicted acetyltransferase